MKQPSKGDRLWRAHFRPAYWPANRSRVMKCALVKEIPSNGSERQMIMVGSSEGLLILLVLLAVLGVMGGT